MPLRRSPQRNLQLTKFHMKPQSHYTCWLSQTSTKFSAVIETFPGHQSIPSPYSLRNYPNTSMGTVYICLNIQAWVITWNAVDKKVPKVSLRPFRDFWQKMSKVVTYTWMSKHSYCTHTAMLGNTESTVWVIGLDFFSIAWTLEKGLGKILTTTLTTMYIKQVLHSKNTTR